MGCLAHDFEIVPKLVSKHVLSKIMRSSSTVDGRVTLYFPQASAGGGCFGDS